MRASPATKANRKLMYGNLRKQGMASKQAFKTVGRRFPVVRGSGRVSSGGAYPAFPT